MSWKDYILTPDELYPGDPVLSASYILNEETYTARTHVILDPNYYFSEFSGKQYEPYFYSFKSDLGFHPVFSSEEFGYTFEESTHSYKSGTGNVDSNSISWTSSFTKILTQEYNFFYGALSNFKTFISSDGKGGSTGFSYDNESYYDLFFETYRPGVNYWKFTGNDLGSLSFSMTSPKPSWLDNTDSPPAPGGGEYSVYLMETSDDGLLMHDPSVTASGATSMGWTVADGKAYIIY